MNERQRLVVYFGLISLALAAAVVAATWVQRLPPLQLEGSTPLTLDSLLAIYSATFLGLTAIALSLITAYLWRRDRSRDAARAAEELMDDYVSYSGPFFYHSKTGLEAELRKMVLDEEPMIINKILFKHRRHSETP